MLALRGKLQHHLRVDFSTMHLKHYGTKIDWSKLRPLILKRISNRANQYPIKSMIPVAQHVIKFREVLVEGVSTLLMVVPVKSCKFCPEVYVGDEGHQIKTCCGFKRMTKNKPHCWSVAKLTDILPPVECYHLQHMHQSVIRHGQRFDFPRIPAVLELCYQAGISEEALHYFSPEVSDKEGNADKTSVFSGEDINSVAQITLNAWESLREELQKLLLVYPAKVCKHCSEVHIGPSAHKARLCGIFEHEPWKGAHIWKRAEVDDLLPTKMVWHRRPQDPPVLVDSGRGFYGHAPAVVELCLQAGARVPTKYSCTMKVRGLNGT